MQEIFSRSASTWASSPQPLLSDLSSRLPRVVCRRSDILSCSTFDVSRALPGIHCDPGQFFILYVLTFVYISVIIITESEFFRSPKEVLVSESTAKEIARLVICPTCENHGHIVYSNGTESEEFYGKKELRQGITLSSPELLSGEEKTALLEHIDRITMVDEIPEELFKILEAIEKQLEEGCKNAYQFKMGNDDNGRPCGFFTEFFGIELRRFPQYCKDSSLRFLTLAIYSRLFPRSAQARIEKQILDSGLPDHEPPR